MDGLQVRLQGVIRQIEQLWRRFRDFQVRLDAIEQSLKQRWGN